MKLLNVLLVAQTVLIVFLLGRLGSIDDRIRDIGATALAPPSETQDVFSARSDCAPNTPLSLSEGMLREIVASELSMQLETFLPNHWQQNAGDEAPQLSEPENQRQLARVAERIEYHASVGRISPTDMMALQSEIAKLDPVGRKQMMRELVQRMNSGQLEGRL